MGNIASETNKQTFGLVVT